MAANGHRIAFEAAGKADLGEAMADDLGELLALPASTGRARARYRCAGPGFPTRR
jgi:hypothetical protein